MQLGLVGLGKMGFNMRERLRRAGHEVVGYDRNPDLSDSASLADLVKQLDAPRTVWVMVPSGEPTRQTVHALADELSAGDLVIDGGNSRFTDDKANAAFLAERDLHYLDCGVSGGVWGLEVGYGLMAGGDAADVERAMPIFDALRPEGPREEGFAHAGKVGAGHFAKMVHNGIEYGLMQAYAEGYELLSAVDEVTDVHAVAQGVDPGHRGPVLAAGPAGQGAGGGPGPGEDQRLVRRLRRGPVDGERGDRPRGAGAGDLGGAVRAVRLPAGGLARDEGGRRAAQPVRWARGARSGSRVAAGRLSEPVSVGVRAAVAGH